MSQPPTQFELSQIIPLLTTIIHAGEEREKRMHNDIKLIRDDVDVRFNRLDTQMQQLITANKEQDTKAAKIADVAAEGLQIADTLRNDASKAGGRAGGIYGVVGAVIAALGMGLAAFLSRPDLFH